MSNQMDDLMLPELPNPLRAVVVMVSAVGSTHKTPAEAYYTTNQMREYAKRAVEAEREACAKVCEKKPEIRTTLDGPSIRETVGKRIAAEIRERR